MDPIDSTLFLIPPDDKFLCCNHGGLMSCPVINIECGHVFCPSCIETLAQCPIDHMIINTLDINFQLKNELDQLLCYCKFGVEELDGMLTVRHDGCGSIISYGSKTTHEESCRHNPANALFSSDSEFDRINSPRISSFDSSSTASSPATSASSSTSKSFSVIHNDHFDINNEYMTNSSSSNSISSINSNTIVGNTSKPITPRSSQQQQQYHDAYDNTEKNEMWESSTNLFYSSSRFCPNKDNGCYYYGKSDDVINFHLENECQAQRMKNRINQLESIIEKKDCEITNLKTSMDILKPDPKKTIVTRSSVGDIFLFIIISIKKRITKGLQRIKKLFSTKTYKKL